MRAIASVPVTLLFALSACGPDAPAEPAEPVAEATACPITAPTRLVAAPDDFTAVESDDTWHDLHDFGDELLFTFDRISAPDRQYFRLNRCTGELAPYAALVPDLYGPYLVDTPGGRILYANDRGQNPYVIDRFDVPGDDEARPVLGLPAGVFWVPITGAPVAEFFLFETSPDDAPRRAAGVGARTYALYTHAGDPDVPARRIGARLISRHGLDDTHNLVLEDSGELFRVDSVTGERELVLAGVRHLEHGTKPGRFIWQAMGDDSVEPVYLRDLDSGEDIPIAVNDFAATSWGRDPARLEIGEWRYIHAETPVGAMIGPGDRFVTAVRLDTGEAIPVPPHLEQRGAAMGYFRLLLADGPEEVEALWDPRTGELREWYRGPDAPSSIHFLDDDRLEYFVADGPDYTGRLWRVDLTTGETVALLSGALYRPHRVSETHYLIESFPGPGGPPAWDYQPWLTDLALVDVARGASTPIVDRVSGYLPIPGEGLVFIDAFGPEPGLWAHPLPYDASRAGPVDGPRSPAEIHDPARARAISSHVSQNMFYRTHPDASADGPAFARR